MAQGGTGHVKVLSRSDGRSATAAAAYRAATIIQDDRTGLAFDYRKKGGVLEVLSFHPPVQLAPGEAKPAWMERLEALDEYWNEVEQAETRKNSRVAREFLVPLPHELTHAQHVDLAQRISDQIAARYQVAGTACIHAPDKGGDDRNFHVHILFPTRRINLITGELGEKTRELDDKKTGPEEIVWMMGMGEAEINRALEAAGVERRVDWRSIETRHAEAVANGDLVQAAALNCAPQVHEGSRVTQIRRDAEKRAAVSGDSVVESLYGECDLIVYNEASKEMKAAALEHAAALAEVEQSRAGLIEAEARFEEARRAAELARAGLDDDLASGVGYLENSEDEGETQVLGQLVELAEYRKTPQESGVPPEPIAVVEQSEPEQLGFELTMEPESSVECEEPADDDWEAQLDTMLAAADMFPVSAEEEMRRVVHSTVGAVIRSAKPDEPDEDIEELRFAMQLVVITLGEKPKVERDEIARRLSEIVNREKELLGEPIPNIPFQTLAGLLRDFLASIPGLGWIGPSRHTRAMQELAAQEAEQQSLKAQREALELQQAESVPLPTWEEAETLLKQQERAAKISASLPKLKNSGLLEKLELAGQNLPSDTRTGLSSLPGFGWIGAKERERARLQREQYQKRLADALEERKKLDNLQQELDALQREIAAAEQRPGMAEQLEAVKVLRDRVNAARKKWAQDRDSFCSELSRVGYQLGQKAQREIERGNREWGARHAEDRRVISAAIEDAKALAKEMALQAQNLSQRVAAELSDGQALRGFKPTEEHKAMLELAQEQLVALPLLADQLEEQRELQRKTEHVERPQEQGRGTSAKLGGPKL